MSIKGKVHGLFFVGGLECGSEVTRGDVVFFDWRNTPHSTANCGTHDRPILKITGVIQNDDYVLLAKDDGIVETIDL